MNTLLQQSTALEKRGRFAEALLGYRQVLAREPDNIDALFALGRANCHQGRVEDGAKTLRHVIALAPNHAPAHNLLGMALDRLGHTQEALLCFEHAVAADPKFAAAIANQADALAALGRHDEAVAQFDKTLALDAANVVAWCNRGNALEALGRDLEAAASFQRALAIEPNSSVVHFNLANALQRLQRHEDAVRHYRHAIALQPELTRAHANLGAALSTLDRWQEAAQSFERAIKLQPGDAALHYALGVALWHGERFSDCIVSFDKALAIDPTNSQAMNIKARAQCILGRVDEARCSIESAIALEPGNADNYLALSGIKRFAPGDPQLTAMEKLLPGIEARPPEQQSALHFALAKAYREVDKYEASFSHLVQANALTRRLFDYDERAVLENLGCIRQIFTPALMQGHCGHGNPSQQPIFIVGMPRSGTTLVEQILASHPRVTGAGERKDFREALLGLNLATDYPECIPAMTPDQFGKLGTAYLASMMASFPAADRMTDKLPANFAYVGLIHLALPNARIIHMRRDPIDTCFSCFSIPFFDEQRFACDLGQLGRFYRAYEALMAHWRQVLPAGAMIEVQYEDVVENVEAAARRILAYCDLEWDDACLAFHENERPVRTASATQVRQPIYRGSIGRWRPYRDQLQPLFAALGINPD